MLLFLRERGMEKRKAKRRRDSINAYCVNLGLAEAKKIGKKKIRSAVKFYC